MQSAHWFRARVVLALCALALVPALAAREGDGERANSPALQSTDPLLRSLSGTWKGTQVAGGAELAETVRWNVALGGCFLECRVEIADPVAGTTVLEGHGFLRHETAAGTYTLHWFDSAGRAVRYEGRREGDLLVLAGETPTGRERLAFAATESGYRCACERAVAGSSDQRVWETSYSRAKPKKAANKD